MTRSPAEQRAAEVVAAVMLAHEAAVAAAAVTETATPFIKALRFEFDPNNLRQFPNMSVADAIREAAACNARLNALRRAFPKHLDAVLADHAYWSGSEAPSAEMSVQLYERQFYGMSKNRQKKSLRAFHEARATFPLAEDVDLYRSEDAT